MVEGPVKMEMNKKDVNSFGYKLGQTLGALVAICLGALFVTITIVLMCKIWTFAF